MQSEQQFEQLMLQYEQLKNGAEDILRLIESEDYDGAMTMIKSRESIFLNCKCMLRYLELTTSQQESVDKIVSEIKDLEQRNIKILSDNMSEVQRELKTTQKTEKIQNAYEFNEGQMGSIINIQDEI